LAVGGAGGATIISGTSTVAMQSLWLHKDIKQAMDAPRLHNQLQPNRTLFENLLAPVYTGFVMAEINFHFTICL
jgi:gamma-glutamyltranspeptidase/glutathione hydrolase/leukotriene-C4 hydrolase